jgi:hypothetical protein
MLRLYYMVKICRGYKLSRELTVSLVSWMFWPRPAADNSMLPHFLATWVVVGQQTRPLWDDMNWVRLSRTHLHERHARMRLALRDGFAVAKERIWCEWHGVSSVSLLL